MARFNIDIIAQAIATKASGASHPTIVAIDGRSGVGKSTWPRELAGELRGGGVIAGDDFFAGGNRRRSCTSARPKSGGSGSSSRARDR